MVRCEVEHTRQWAYPEGVVVLLVVIDRPGLEVRGHEPSKDDELTDVSLPATSVRQLPVREEEHDPGDQEPDP